VAEDQVSALLDLYVEEEVLGNTRLIREAGVCFGHLTVGPMADHDLPLTVQRRADRGKRRFDLLNLPFQLEHLEGRKHYVDAQVRITFDEPGVRSVQLIAPEQPPVETHVVLTTSASGLNALEWRLTSRDEKLGIRPGGREVQAIVESPLTYGPITGSLDASARYVTPTTRWVTSKDANPKQPLRFSLDLADGAFGYLPAQ
jgi:hypothetical protein